MNIHRCERLGVALLAGVVLWMMMLCILPLSRPVRAEMGALYVKPAGSGTACTQATPCTLPTALGKAANGDSLYLGAGTYTGVGSGAVVSLTKSLVLLGGWTGAAAGAVVRDPVAFPSLLDGQRERRVLAVNSGLTVTLEGLTVVNGWVEGNGGGVYASGANLTLRAMTFLSNAVSTTVYAFGGGTFVEWGSLVVENSTFRHNWSFGRRSSWGGGLALSMTNWVSVTDCVFEGNDSWHSSGLYLAGAGEATSRFYLADSSFVDNGHNYSHGLSAGAYSGAFSISDARSRIERNTIKGNRAGQGRGVVAIVNGRCALDRNQIVGNQSWNTGGIYLFDVAAYTLTNNVVAANVAGGVGSAAITLWGGGGLLTHNTIAANHTEYGVSTDRRGGPVLINNIVVSHTVGVFAAVDCTVTLEGTLWGYGPWANGTNWSGPGLIYPGDVNVIGLPDFIDAANGDYRIGAQSAAIDAGVPNGAMVDMDGTVRPWGAGWDIGAYEYRPPGVYRFLDLPLLLRLK